MNGAAEGDCGRSRRDENKLRTETAAKATEITPPFIGVVDKVGALGRNRE